MRISCGLAILVLLMVAYPRQVIALPDPALTGSTTATGFSGAAMPVDIQVAGTGNPTVPVKLRVTSGSLAMSTTSGLTFTGGSTGSTLQFSGTLTNVNAALATLTYTRTGTGSDTLEASLVNAGEVFFPGTGHLYEYVSYTASWNNANTNAQTRTKYGATGYLTTITSQPENDFVTARLLNAGWMGASDATSEGDWRWVTGPESGTSFWSGTSTGSTVGGRYANWGGGEPNNAGEEDCAQFLTGGTGMWNDLPCSSSTLPGYVVEYGSTGSPIDISSLNVAITTQAANNYPNAPASLGPTAQVNGSFAADDQPSLGFTLSDSDGANTVRYRVQVDDSANFSSPVVDYTSALAAQGARTFTIGQAAGGGTYSIGSSGQSLSDGQYYWRVRAIDNLGAESAYTVANSGAAAFQIDTEEPTVPVATVSSADNDTTPTLNWTAATDVGAGLDPTEPYRIYWSQSPTFSSSTSMPATGTSFTLPSNESLTDGTWYFRVVALDALGSSVNAASVSVTIDVTAPTTPGKPLAQTASSVNKPTWTWAGSSDDGVGLASPAYLVEWSRAANFSGTIYASVSPLASFTHTSPLADGTWYFRVSAADDNNNESAYSAAGSVNIDTAVRTPVVTVRPTAPAATPPATVVDETSSSFASTASAPIVTIPLVRVLVVDKDGKPIPGAKVTLHSEPRTAYSGADGYAVFTDVPAGDHRVVVTYKGVTKEQALEVKETSKDITANVTLQAVASTSDNNQSTKVWLISGLLIIGYLWWFVYRRRRKDDKHK